MAIKKHNWLIVVEDATLESMASIRDYLYGDGKRGTLLITSQVGPRVFRENKIDIGCAVELGPWSLADCVKHFEGMKIFSRKVTPDDVKNADEKDIKSRCGATKGRIKYVPPSGRENSSRRKNRLRPMMVALRSWEQLYGGDSEHKEKLQIFFKETLGGLPLAVRLCGHLFRMDPKMLTMVGLIQLYDTIRQEQVDRDGRDNFDTQLFGVLGSVMISIRRMRERLPERQGKNAMDLLRLLAILPGSGAPLSLLSLPSDDEDAQERVLD